MTVYVDDAVHPFRGMLMCHLWSESLDELYAMVDLIGVQRRWLQQPPFASWVHFDISKGRRDLAIRNGAIATDKYGPVEHVCRLRIATGDPVLIGAANAKLAQIRSIRERYRVAMEPQGELFA